MKKLHSRKAWAIGLSDSIHKVYCASRGDPATFETRRAARLWLKRLKANGAGNINARVIRVHVTISEG